ncbi:CPBP family intramembrane metalloprotease, partial [Candidatus Bathyarchaeota archaeon]|nr:CPBP family intramembrane metalloprotease [Candidatus Bathyarchaeota archaeon]
LIITVILSIGFYLLAILMGPILLYLTPEGISTSLLNLKALPIWLLNIPIYIPIRIEFRVVFFGLWTIFILCFIAAGKIRKNFLKTIQEEITEPTMKLFNSSLFALPVINSMTLIVVVILQSIQEASGIPTGTPPINPNPFLDFVDLSYAAVSEELGFRLIPIGIFLIIYFSLTKKMDMGFSWKQKVKLFFSSFLFPDKAKKMLGKKTISEYGIKTGISLGEWGMLIFTSVLFGLTHFNPGISWEIGKVTSAGFSGLIIGLSYLIYGIHASIITHWFFNSYNNIYLLLSEIYPAATPFGNSVLILSIILGILGWLILAGLISRKIVRKILEKRKKIH